MPCAKCGNSASRACRACSMIGFCSEACEKALWTEHKDQCGKLLQKLVDRIGIVLLAVFYVFAERAFATNVNDIAIGPDGIMVFESSDGVQQTHQALYPFPADLVPNIQDRHAVLCADRSEHALAYLHDFIARMLKGVPLLKVEEVGARMVQSPKAAILSRADPRGDRHVKAGLHHFLRLQAIMFGKSWALDPAGALYGVRDACMASFNHAKTYVRDRQATVHKFGHHKEKLDKFARDGGLPGLLYQVLGIARDRLNHGTAEWENQTQLTLPKLLRLSDDQFTLEVGRLRTCVHESMSQIIMSDMYQLAIQNALH